MSEAVETAPAVTPEATPAPEVVPPPVEVKPPESQDPAWLPERLARAKSSGVDELLKTAGFGSVEELQNARDELQKLKDAQLSEQERAQKERDELKLRADRAGALEATVSSFANRELAGLTEAQASAVKAIAGEDPARILATIDSLKPTWAAAALPPAQEPKEQLDTTAQVGGPPAAGSQSTIDHKAEFNRLKSENPFRASQYYAAHQAEILA